MTKAAPRHNPSASMARVHVPPDAPAPTYGQGRGGRPWRRKVEAVKLRDKYICQMCGRIAIDGQCDHRIPEFEGGTDDMANLQWLCREPCHSEKTKAEAARGAQQARPRAWNRS